MASQISKDALRMASRWRRQRLCILTAADRPTLVSLRSISGSGARLETDQPPALGSRVELRHPEVGVIAGFVTSHTEDGVQLAFPGDESAVAFALGAIVSDMTRAD
jgi:hypothetical protein